MNSPDSFENYDVERLKTFIYLVPVVGVIPALWTLYRRTGTRQQRAASRLAVMLTVSWVFAYLLLDAGANSTAAMHLPLLVVSSLFTSGYFLINLWLMIRLWQRKPLSIPGMGQSRKRGNLLR
jgi:hypothetical protein